MTIQDGKGPRVGPVRALRRAARQALHDVDRALHPLRRALAHRRLRRVENVTSVVFICHGNICRSPYAEVALREHELLRGRDIRIGSAGFTGPDRPSPPEALTVASARGHDLTPHRSRLIDAEALEADLVVVMDVGQRRAVTRGVASGPRRERRRGPVLLLGDLDPEPIRRRTIPDPWGRSETHFEWVYERIDRCVDALALSLPPVPVVRGGGGR